jgi:hypothetical protein
MYITARYKAQEMCVTVRFKRKHWVQAGIAQHVEAKIYFTEDCELEERVPNPEWGIENTSDLRTIRQERRVLERSQDGQL